MYPVLFHLGGFTLHTYGVMLMLGFMAAIAWAYRSAKRDPQGPNPIRPDDVLDVGIWLVISGIIGARLMFVALDWASYRKDPASAARIWEGGMSFHGGLFAGMAAMIAFCLIKKVSLLRMADLYAPGIMLGYAIGRVGCLLNGCCYGAPTRMPWGIRFHDVDASGHAFVTPPSHPTQIYATLLSLVFFAGLVWLTRRKAFDGQLACWYLIGASVERFVMEIWRAGTTSTVVAWGLTDVQFLCLSMGAIAAFGLYVFRRRGQSATPRKPATLEAVRP